MAKTAILPYTINILEVTLAFGMRPFVKLIPKALRQAIRTLMIRFTSDDIDQQGYIHRFSDLFSLKRLPRFEKLVLRLRKQLDPADMDLVTKRAKYWIRSSIKVVFVLDTSLDKLHLRSG
ncbi:hypothetical protein N0V83_009195 [Neocucurbitaria cava]|uniref:Uncharacterized protein n=1 Tax=Neocucurbitaria cava TaxID=798079 RepID=A0A9W8Y0N1_9PLEO|nr:hypothetical protein N0V83_009195 [Neocucurbitaria cava]